MRSILFPLLVCFLVFARLSERDAVFLFGAVLSNAAADGKRRRTQDRQVIEKVSFRPAQSARPAEPA
jgi:hypothetical protein